MSEKKQAEQALIEVRKYIEISDPLDECDFGCGKTYVSQNKDFYRLSFDDSNKIVTSRDLIYWKPIEEPINGPWIEIKRVFNNRNYVHLDDYILDISMTVKNAIYENVHPYDICVRLKRLLDATTELCKLDTSWSKLSNDLRNFIDGFEIAYTSMIKIGWHKCTINN